MYAYAAYEDGTVLPKRRHIKFRRRGITQKKEYNEFYIWVSVHHKSITQDEA